MYLHGACKSGDTLAAIALVDRGVSVNEKDQHGRTPLHFACYSGHTITAVALIKKGANVNEKHQFGWNPLHFACNSGHTATAIVLLENGAVGVNEKDNIGCTPSFYACRECSANVVLRMIRHGAILTAADLQSLRDRSTVTEEQARTVEAVYMREDNWRRRAQYAMFLSSIRDLVDVGARA